MSKTILMVAAEAMEFQGLLSRLTANRLNWDLHFAREAEWNGNRTILVANGAGPQLAGQAADTARRHVRPDAVVSTGFCGALDPVLKVGDVVVASAVIDSENGKRYPAVPLSSRADMGNSAGCAILSINRVAATVAEKRELRASGARAVEMEAAAVASRAEIWNVPFYCIRTVSDTAGENLGIDLNRMRNPRGAFSRGRIVLSALARPWSRVLALMKLEKSCRMAAKSLGDFLANCRF
jgi:adenosylhomocysteine nucleosidase